MTTDDDVTIYECPQPRCSGKLVRRRNSRTGRYLLGCTNYPECTYTQRDVYRPNTKVGDVYLKLTVIDDVLIVSFKEL